MGKFYFHKKERVNEDYGGFPNMTNPIMGSTMGTQTSQITGYRYEILPFSHSLEQKINDNDDEMVLTRGNVVEGNSMKDNSKHRGMIMNIHRLSDGQIDYVTILDSETKCSINLSTDNLEYINYSKIDPQALRRSNPMEYSF